MSIRLVLPGSGRKGVLGEVEVIRLNLGTDKEVGCDVVAFGFFVSVTDGIRILLVVNIILVDVVLDCVTGVCELFIQCNIFCVTIIRIVFAIADVIDGVLRTEEGIV